jgi:hypothetical protein
MDGREGGASQAATIQPDGTFYTVELPPGHYNLMLSPTAPAGVSILTINIGSQLIEAPIEIATESVGNIAIQIGTHPGSLAGHVLDSQGKLLGGATVLAFPTNASSWTLFPGTSRRFRAVLTDQDGRFKMEGLPDGQYFVRAVTDQVSETWLDPASLKALAADATRSTVRGTSSGELRLTAGRCNSVCVGRSTGMR